MSTLEDAINAIRLGNKEEGRQLLEQLLEAEESNEQVWLWLSTVVDTDEDREICLENVLALDPNNVMAQQGLEAVRAGNFEPSLIIGTAPEEEAEEQAVTDEVSFREQFFAESEQEDDPSGDDIEWPSVMGGSPEPKLKQQREEAKKSKGGLNIRYILLAAIGAFVCLALGAAAAYNFFLAGGDSAPPPDDNQPTQAETPALPTDTPTPAPTPTPTNTPLLLPTAKPTDAPSPTPTQVVSPTPSAPENNEDEGGGDG